MKRLLLSLIFISVYFLSNAQTTVYGKWSYEWLKANRFLLSSDTTLPNTPEGDVKVIGTTFYIKSGGSYVAITGGGGGGLSAVSHDSTMLGNGTSGNPLKSDLTKVQRKWATDTARINIYGAIAGKLSTISHDITLTGSGTAGNQLKVDTTKITSKYSFDTLAARVNSGGGGGGSVSSVGLTSSDFNISGSPVTSSGIITANLNTSGVTAGSYANANITVNNKGIVTAISNGTGGTDTTHIIVRATGTTGYSIIHPASDSTHLLLKKIKGGPTTGVNDGSDSILQIDHRQGAEHFTSGTSGTVTDVSDEIIVNIDPASTLSTFTLYLPATPISNSKIWIIGGGTLTSGTIVTTFTINGNTNTLLGSVSTLTFGTKILVCYTQGKYFIVQ